MANSDITIDLVKKLIKQQFPEYCSMPVTAVEKQGHDNRTFRLGNNLLIRMPIAACYALKTPLEYELLPKLAKYLSIKISAPIKIGKPSNDYPYSFTICKWLDGRSANHLLLNNIQLEPLAMQLAKFLKELHNIDKVKGPNPGQHNWWRGEHISFYDVQAKEQIAKLEDIIDSDKAIKLWQEACLTKWSKNPVWIHGDLASGNILIKDGQLNGIIDFGGMAIGDPACDLVIAWTLLDIGSREVFINEIELDNDTWLRARAWCLWKATFELCQIQDKNSQLALEQRSIIDQILK